VPLEVTSREHDLQTALSLAEVGAVITTPEYKTLLDKVLAQAGPSLSPPTIAIFEEDNIVTLSNPSRGRQNGTVDSARNGKVATSSHLVDAAVSLPAPNGKAHASEAAPIFTERPAMIEVTMTKAGDPKLLLRTHADLVRAAEKINADLQLTSSDRLLCAEPLCQRDNFVPCLIAAVAAGATLVMPAARDWRTILQTLDAERITVFASSAAMLTRLMEMAPDKSPEISALRWCFCLGAPLAPEISASLNKKVGFHVRNFADSIDPVIPSRL
jgi:acyl-coenzyme A synthetase/AMP-(fatty) acid ligase